MNPLWLPTEQIAYGLAKSFRAGTLIFSVNGNKQDPLDVAIRVDLDTEQEGNRPLVLALSSGWYSGRLPFGDIVGASDRFDCMGLTLRDGQALMLEADAARSGAYPDEAGALAWYRDGARLTSHFGRHGDPFTAGQMLIDPLSWRVWRPPAADPGPVMHSADWRLRLRLSEREIVTVAEGKSGS